MTKNLLTVLPEPWTEKPQQILSQSSSTFELEGMHVKYVQVVWPQNINRIVSFLVPFCNFWLWRTSSDNVTVQDDGSFVAVLF